MAIKTAVYEPVISMVICVASDTGSIRFRTCVVRKCKFQYILIPVGGVVGGLLSARRLASRDDAAVLAAL
jgi:hypothetical protein